MDVALGQPVNTLVITDVHGRDIVDGFVRDSVLSASAFAWESQLRLYWERATVSRGHDAPRAGGRGARVLACTPSMLDGAHVVAVAGGHQHAVLR